MAKITELLAAGPTLSYEFFPPKTDDAERALEKAIIELAPLEPSFVSVTYGALGSTRERTRDIVVRINDEQDFPAMAHLTCVGHTRADVVELLEHYRDKGIENILALGGDPPADGQDPGGDFAYASQLIEVVREVDNFSIGVAAHPELHPRSPDRDSDRRYLAAKLAISDFAITQFFFVAEEYFRLRDELAELGCDKPVLPGIMPIISVAGVKRMAAMNNTLVPGPLLDRLHAAEDDPDEVFRIGVDVCTELTRAMLDAGTPGVHLYALNRSESIRAIYANLGLGPARD
ncbi:MAG: methylenetetrahydrofolate reductase [Acidimicrobiales bacterium]